MNTTPKRVVGVGEIERAASAVQYIVADDTQVAAIDLYRRGLNVFPLAHGTKDQHFGPWRRLQTTRLLDPDQGSDAERAEHLAIFLRLFENANIAVMVGRTSQNLVVLDCENEVSAQKHAREFARRGLHPWVVRTARGVHFWWFSDYEIANNPDDKTETRGWEIRGHSCYVLCPPSLHPSGATYRWVERNGEQPPRIDRAALDWLPLAPTVTRRTTRITFDDSPLARLSKKTRDFCEDGAAVGERNNRLFAAACDFASKGFSINDALTYLLQGCARSGYDTRPSDNFTKQKALRTIRSAFDKPRHSTKAPAPIPTWARAIAWAESHTWQSLGYTTTRRGRAVTKRVSKDTVRAVFVACCVRLRLDGWRTQEQDTGGVFRAARREVAELANVSQRTATNALTALVQAGYLLDRGKSEITGARLFAMPNSICTKVPSNTQWFNIIGHFCAEGIEADIFSGRAGRRKGLPKSARRVWHSITEKPMTCKQISNALRCSVGTVRRAVVELEKHGLARRVGRFMWIGDKRDDAHLREIARRCNTLGRSQERKEQHARERARYITLQMLRHKDRYEKARAWERRAAKFV